MKAYLTLGLIVLTGCTSLKLSPGGADRSPSNSATPAMLYQPNDAIAFEVKPRLQITSLGARIVWRYARRDAYPSVQLQLNKFGGESQYLPPQHTSEIDYAELPDCWANKMSYLLPGMAEAKEIQAVPCTDTPQAVNFAFLTDTQLHPEIAGQFAEKIKSFHPQFILHAGDHVEHALNRQEWLDYFDRMNDLYSESALFPAVGNHEYQNHANGRDFRVQFGLSAEDPLYFSKEVGPIRFIILNSNFIYDPNLIFQEVGWLRQQLATSTRAAWTIVVFHHAPFASGVMNLGVWGYDISPNPEFEKVRALFVPLFEQYKVSLVLNGHTHLFERSEKNAVTYLTGGPAGGQMGFFPQRTILGANPYSLHAIPGVRTWSLITATSEKLRVVTTDLYDHIVDDFTIDKPL